MQLFGKGLIGEPARGGHQRRLLAQMRDIALAARGIGLVGVEHHQGLQQIQRRRLLVVGVEPGTNLRALQRLRNFRQQRRGQGQGAGAFLAQCLQGVPGLCRLAQTLLQARQIDLRPRGAGRDQQRLLVARHRGFELAAGSQHIGFLAQVVGQAHAEITLLGALHAVGNVARLLPVA
ncbi:hypothetical protein D3C71_1630520 [compost metagenome]